VFIQLLPNKYLDYRQINFRPFCFSQKKNPTGPHYQCWRVSEKNLRYFTDFAILCERTDTEHICTAFGTERVTRNFPAELFLVHRNSHLNRHWDSYRFPVILGTGNSSPERKTYHSNFWWRGLGYEYMDLHLHYPYASMVVCLITKAILRAILTLNAVPSLFYRFSK
jgi:hypothetical protein